MILAVVSDPWETLFAREESEKSENDDFDDRAGEGEGEGDRRPSEKEDRRGADELDDSSPFEGDSDAVPDEGESLDDLNRGMKPENPDEVLMMTSEPREGGKEEESREKEAVTVRGGARPSFGSRGSCSLPRTAIRSLTPPPADPSSGRPDSLASASCDEQCLKVHINPVYDAQCLVWAPATTTGSPPLSPPATARTPSPNLARTRPAQTGLRHSSLPAAASLVDPQPTSRQRCAPDVGQTLAG